MERLGVRALPFRLQAQVVPDANSVTGRAPRVEIALAWLLEQQANSLKMFMYWRVA
jgi:hypothetical protein